MAYGTWKTYEEVAEKFEIELLEKQFVQESPIAINQGVYDFITHNLGIRRNYITENSICETMISPILNTVATHHQLAIWSHVRFDVSEQDGLIGTPDYLIARPSKIGTTFQKPVICVAEAKKENFNEGWAQALSEMIAAREYNQNENIIIYGIVTTGDIWKFSSLQNQLFTMDIIAYSALENLQKLFNIIHWLFEQAEQQYTK